MIYHNIHKISKFQIITIINDIIDFFLFKLILKTN